jgi:hypothetical protein
MGAYQEKNAEGQIGATKATAIIFAGQISQVPKIGDRLTVDSVTYGVINVFTEFYRPDVDEAGAAYAYHLTLENL